MTAFAIELNFRELEFRFVHILATTFPLVAEPVKTAALNAFSDTKRGLVK